jgi:hypothetical protein
MEHLKDGLQTLIFMSLIILLCWAIWTTRNGLIFEELKPTVLVCRFTFKKELDLLQHRVKLKHKQHLEEWLTRFAQMLFCICFSFFLSFFVSLSYL